eukprot:1519839-Rhodomonas_salina.1
MSVPALRVARKPALTALLAEVRRGARGRLFAEEGVQLPPHHVPVGRGDVVGAGGAVTTGGGDETLGPRVGEGGRGVDARLRFQGDLVTSTPCHVIPGVCTCDVA